MNGNLYKHNDDSVIAPIQQTEIKRIVAGQAICDIASAVKELIDNALDAKATSINIRLFNQGIDVIEVSDDGTGVPMHSRHMMAKKHATSKIRSFSELYEDTVQNGTVETRQLGFRGEALFSLANVSLNLVVSTRTKGDGIGQKLEFTREGFLKENSITDIPRKVGTTVAVVKLFDALPVRRADLIKRIKAQRAKLLRLIQSYAVLCTKVRFNVVDIVGTPVGSRNCSSEVKLSTSGNPGTGFANSISSVFGAKFLAGLCKIQVDLSSLFSERYAPWRIEGLISQSPSMDLNGKMAREVQFYCINGRPVEIPRFSRVIADVWKNYDSSGKRPACILALFLPNRVYDVNMVPDKRQVLLTEEASICDKLRHALSSLWSEQSHGKFQENEVMNQSTGKRTQAAIDPQVESWEMRRMKRLKNNNTADLQQTFKKLLPSTTASMNKKQVSIAASLGLPQLSHTASEGPSQSSNNLPSSSSSTSTSHNDGTSARRGKMRRRNAFINSFDNIGKMQPDNLLEEDIAMLDKATAKVPRNIPNKNDDKTSNGERFSSRRATTQIGNDGINKSHVNLSQPQDMKPEDSEEKDVIWGDFETTDYIIGLSQNARLQSLRFKDKLIAKQNKSCTTTGKDNGSKHDASFDPSSQECNTVSLKKEDFQNMKIVGQFNMGFILALFDEQHLFIIDQHAADEIHNFERLRDKTIFSQQNLLVPLPLELSPSEENCILENKDIFEQNGFKFTYDGDKEPRHRLSLTAIPHSAGGDGCKPVQFGKEDVEAMCAILGADGASGYIAGSGTGATGEGLSMNHAVRRHVDTSKSLLRPPKAIAMFASRACRKSTMIGDCLSKKQMQQIVKKMYNTQQPWTCPHGRPTIRHVKSLIQPLLDDEMKKSDESNGASMTILMR